MGGLRSGASLPTASVVSTTLPVQTSAPDPPVDHHINASFYYLSGADFPGCAATYDVGADKLTLWIPHTPPATVLWLGTTPSVEECLARCDVHDVQHASGLPAYLVARLPRVRGPLYALRPDQLPDFDGFERMRPRLDVDVAALCPAMDEARLIKDDFEVAMIRRACEVSAEAHRAVAKALAGCVNECQIEASFLNSVRLLSSC